MSSRKPRKPKKGKSLAEINPKLAGEWHPTKNGNLTPYDVGPGYEKVWWKCSNGKWPDGSIADDHEFEALVSNRVKNAGTCSVCAGKVAVPSNSLNTLYPELSQQWHPVKNEKEPIEITAHSGKKVWWKCYDGRLPDGSVADDHEWEASPDRRIRERGCPYCDGHRVCLSNSLKTNYPELMKEWHPLKNKKDPSLILPGHNGKAWWKCFDGKWPDGSPADDHEWEAQVASRALGESGCPFCRGLKTVASNCLATTHPELAKEWHPTKNIGLTPHEVTAGSNEKVWWKCDDGLWPDGSPADDHEWRAYIKDRTSKSQGCSCCSSKTIVPSNCLKTTKPKLAKEWHPTKNDGLTPNDVSAGSNSKVWWKCPKGPDHEWRAVINSRNQGKGCPWCVLTPQSKQELTITFELMLIFKDINPKGFNIRIKEKLRSIDIYVPSLKLGIEFDGSYWHKGKEKKDKQKTLEINKLGFDIIRIRPKPSLPLPDVDCLMTEEKYDGKQIVNALLKKIVKQNKLNITTTKRINKYVLKSCLQNEESLDKYIDKLLADKAIKKKNAKVKKD